MIEGKRILEKIKAGNTFHVAVLGQTGTWDPLLQCLHLDTPLLEQQDTKKLYGTKNNCVHVQLGQILDKR